MENWSVSLGFAIGTDFNEIELWKHICRNVNHHFLAGDIDNIIQWGGAMLENCMIPPRFRYWAHAMHMPAEILCNLAADVHAVIWNKTCWVAIF